MEWCVQFKAQPHNFGLAHVDERSGDLNGSFFRAGMDYAVEGFIVGGTTVGIAGAILLDCADKDFLRSQNLGPAYGGGQKMGVAKGYIGHWNGVADGVARGVGSGHSDAGIGEGGAPDSAQRVIADEKFVLNI